jgi:hypothetical protein
MHNDNNPRYNTIALDTLYAEFHTLMGTFPDVLEELFDDEAVITTCCEALVMSIKPGSVLGAALDAHFVA